MFFSMLSSPFTPHWDSKKTMKTRLALACALLCASLCPTFAVTPADYGKEIVVTVSNAVGDKTATDAVVPIQLSTSIVDFSYTDFQESDGTDLLITDSDGNVLSYEIDLWNPDGTTTVWVKVPTIAAGTILHVYFKGARNTDNVPTSVWSRFLGVWHFNETSSNGTSASAYDASGHNLTGYDTPKTTSVAGLFGLARQPRGNNYANNGVGGVFLPAMTLNSRFAISGCFKVVNHGNPAFFANKTSFSDPGFYFGSRSTWSSSKYELLGDAHTDGWNSTLTGLGDYGSLDWHAYCFVTDDDTTGNNFWLYVDGSKSGTGPNGHSFVTDTANGIGVGNVPCDEAKADNGPGGNTRSFCGQMDEIRIQSYANFDSDREYFEGATMTDPSLLQYSAVRTAVAPTALSVDFSATPVAGIAPLAVEFTAAPLHASGACTYYWDFDGDGTYDETTTSATITYTYPERSLNTVALKVVDGDSHEATAQKTDFINVLTPMTVDCTASVDTVVTGVEVEFYAEVANAHEGACSYAWDFDGDGTVDATTTVPTATYSFSNRGTYTLILTVTDSAGDVKSVTKANLVEVTPPAIVGGKIYVDFDASIDGIGTQENPFNSLTSALSVANDGYTIYAKGMCDISEWTETFTFDIADLVVTQWGDAKPVVLSTATTKNCPNALFSLDASGIVLSDIDFRFTRETLNNSKPLISVDATGCTITRCDFRFTNARVNANGTCGNKGIIGCMSSADIGLVVSKCTFTDIETYMDQNAGILFVTDGVTMLENRFTNCSRILGQAGMNWGTALQFTSNIVINSTVADVDGNQSGALLRGGWGYYCQGNGSAVHKFNYNIFANFNNDGGSVLNIPSKTFQKGAYIHNNTIYGFKNFIFDAYDGNDWIIYPFNNLFASSSSGAFYECSKATAGATKASYLRNNACASALCTAGVDFSKYTIEDNIENIGSVPFISMSPTSPNFMGVSAGSTSWIYSAWTNDGAYPAYIGAVDPSTLQLSTLILFR